MDLKGLLNDSGPPPSGQAKPPPPQTMPPSTPIQTVPPPAFHDYNQTPPIRSAPDFSNQQIPGGYGSPTSYAIGLPYSGRAQPPPLQHPPPNDPRSPGMSSGPVLSPYRQTPAFPISATSGSYPFPSPAPQPPSPAPLHQYPPAGAYRRDSYSQASPISAMVGLPGPSPYIHGVPVPQTPPIGTSGSAHPYSQQRPHSTHSTPSSQPPTPLGPPLNQTRQASVGSLTTTLELTHDAVITPAKRKLEDRELRPDELEKRDLRPAPTYVSTNGSHRLNQTAAVPHSQLQDRPQTTQASSSTLPMARERRAKYYANKPIWATEQTSDRQLNKANFVVHKPKNPHLGHVNGEGENSVTRREQSSRHASPDEKRLVAAPQQPPQEHADARVRDVPNAHGPLGPWEPTIFGQRPQEELTRLVADWLFLNVLRNPYFGEIQGRGIKFEIEAKLGILVDTRENGRLRLPVLSECAIDAEALGLHFRSSMTLDHHRQFNNLLNEACTAVHRAKPPTSRVEIKYTHTKEIDKFFELPASMRSELPSCMQGLLPAKRNCKVRVSYEGGSRQLMAKIIKARVANFHLYFPDSPLDCRISINLEMDWDGSVEGLERLASSGRDPAPDRAKDRMSYKQSHYSVDLTQVTTMGPNSTQGAEREHELEIEVDSNVFIEQARRLSTGQPNQYPELVEGLVDNVRLLARKAKMFTA